MYILGKNVSLFARQHGDRDTHLNWFSVVGRQLSSHVVVLFDGDDNGTGSWVCMKDRESTCEHVLLAQGELQDILEAGGHQVEEWQEMGNGQGGCLYLSCRELQI